MSYRGWLIALALGAAFVTGTRVDEAAAKKKSKRSSFSVTVNGHHWKAGRERGKDLVPGFYGSVEVSVGGGTKPTLRKAALAMAVSCLVDIRAVSFPVTVSNCCGDYREVTIRGGVVHEWQGCGMQVIYQSFDGTRLTGTFSGTLDEPTAAESGPATVEDGKFSAILTLLGG